MFLRTDDISKVRPVLWLKNGWGNFSKCMPHLFLVIVLHSVCQAMVLAIMLETNSIRSLHLSYYKLWCNLFKVLRYH